MKIYTCKNCGNQFVRWGSGEVKEPVCDLCGSENLSYTENISEKDLRAVLLELSKDDKAAAKFIAALIQQFEADDESFSTKGKKLVRAYLSGDTEDMIIYLTGRTMRSLLDFIENIPYNSVDACYYSVWDTSYTIGTKCKANMMTHKLIGLPSVDIEGVETLEKEYVIINGETYPACHFSERKNYPEDETVFTYE